MGTRRSRGWYWLYDRTSTVLWIWQWNYQHCTLGWETGSENDPAHPGTPECSR